MLRTRDFLVFLLVVLLLLSGIATSLVRDSGVVIGEMSSDSQLLSAAALIDEYEVVDPDDETANITSSEERLASMRERVRVYRSENQSGNERFVVREGEPELAVTITQTEEADGSQTDSSVRQCVSYQQFTAFWPSNVVIEEHEGARLVIAPDPLGEGSVTEAESVLFSGEVLAQLPIPRQPSGSPTCVSMDVVGIAMDGSLIRNNEYQAYGFFGADTVVGFALDGFPIYGRDDTVGTDQCGGAVGTMGYGYILQNARPAILNCFSGRPTTI